MKITFSCPLELHKVGAGRPYGYLHDYLMSQEKHEVKFIDGRQLVHDLYGAPPPESIEMGTISDLIASFESNLDADVFLGTGCASLMQLMRVWDSTWDPGSRKFKDRTKTVTTWFSTHYDNASAILAEEYAKVGIQTQNPVDQFLIWRDKKEHRRSDALIVPSVACAETYERHPDCKGKTRVVGFGVDSELFHPPEKPADQFRVLYAGGNWARKGLHYLLKAWQQLQLDGVLTVVGTTPLYSVWRTHWAGWIPDEQVPQTYRTHPVFCLPTLEEGQALVVLEAMASGCAVITTKESGAPITDGYDGLIIPSRSPEAIEGALKALYESPGMRETLGKNARKKAEQLTWEKFGEGVVKVLEEVAA